MHSQYEQDHAGVVLAACLLIAFVMMILAVTCHADCVGASPEIQKAYKQLKDEGFNVSCRNV